MIGGFFSKFSLNAPLNFCRVIRVDRLYSSEVAMTRYRSWLAPGFAMLALVSAAVTAGAQPKKKIVPPSGHIDPIGMPVVFEKAIGKAAVYGVWYNDGFWHVRATSKNMPTGKQERKTMSGRIRIDGDSIKVEAQGLEKAKKARNADLVILHSYRRGFDFHLATFGRAEGINFLPEKKSQEITFSLLVDGTEMPSRVLIGKRGFQPEKIPFRLPAHPEEKK